jgi:hypothetical protein
MESSLEKLVARITTSANVIYSIPSTSISSTLGTNDSANSSENELVQRARQDISYAARDLLLLLSDPSEYLEQHQVNVSFTSTIRRVMMRMTT